MAKLTIAFGTLLILLGILGYVGTGSMHPTALIPSVLGVFFIFFGIMANTEDAKKRKLWMHISVTVALVGFLSMIPADYDVMRLARGAYFTYPAAVEEKSVMSILCLIYVLFCVRSFIAARRSRIA